MESFRTCNASSIHDDYHEKHPAMERCIQLTSVILAMIVAVITIVIKTSAALLAKVVQMFYFHSKIINYELTKCLRSDKSYLFSEHFKTNVFR